MAERSDDDASTEAMHAGEDVRGPHLWINWQGMRVRQPVRATSHGQSIVVHPLWEEHALYTDAEISGEFNAGPYRILTVHSSSPPRVGRAENRLVLRHIDHLLDASATGDDTDELDMSEWTGGTLGDQMAALVSLALARRVRCGGVVRQGFSPGDPLGAPTRVLHRPPLLAEPPHATMLPGIADPVDVGDAVVLLDHYALLAGADATALTRAAAQFADALWWADVDPRIAWLKLVGALEAAANRADMSIDDDPVAQLKRLRGPLYGQLKGLSPDAVSIVAKALAGTLRPEMKLLSFTLAYAPAPPEVRPHRGRIDYSDLSSTLRGVYECRSRDVHDGVPFPHPLCQPPIAADGVACERFPVLGAGGIRGSDSLPAYLHTFTHIVGGALRRWWAALPAGVLLHKPHTHS